MVGVESITSGPILIHGNRALTPIVAVTRRPVPLMTTGRGSHGIRRAEPSPGIKVNKLPTASHVSAVTAGVITESGPTRNTVEIPNGSTVTLNSTVAPPPLGAAAKSAKEHPVGEGKESQKQNQTQKTQSLGAPRNYWSPPKRTNTCDHPQEQYTAPCTPVNSTKLTPDKKENDTKSYKKRKEKQGRNT